MKLRLFLSVVVVAAAASFLFPVFAQHEQHQAGSPEKLGKVDFRTSCAPEVQEQFNRAVGLLHSFWYEMAAAEFASVAQKDPSCGMAFWGIAMTHYHPLWEPPSLSALQQGLAAVEQAKKAGAKTQRERDYIAAIENFYKDFERQSTATRAAAYEQAMERLHASYPDDREATVFYALALLGTAAASPPDKSYARQKKAGSLAEELFRLQPDHPGLAHYIIHSYDYPALADRAAEAARQYARIAPDSPHALHMPTHIFTRLGMWQESISSNLAAAAAARKHGVTGEELHALDYAVYGYLQRGEDQKAREIAENLPKLSGPSASQFAGLYAAASIPARYALERRRWAEAAALPEPDSTYPGGRVAWTQANVHFARGLGAARNGNVEGAAKAVERLSSLQEELRSANDSYWTGQIEIQKEMIGAWVALAEKNPQEALRRMKLAADREDATDKHPVTPGVVIPARELLGDMLLELGQPEKAVAEFEAVLRGAPNRFNALYGAAKAADLAGDRAKARTFFEKLIQIAPQGERAELREARAYRVG